MDQKKSNMNSDFTFKITPASNFLDSDNNNQNNSIFNQDLRKRKQVQILEKFDQQSNQIGEIQHETQNAAGFQNQKDLQNEQLPTGDKLQVPGISIIQSPDTFGFLSPTTNSHSASPQVPNTLNGSTVMTPLPENYDANESSSIKSKYTAQVPPLVKFPGSNDPLNAKQMDYIDFRMALVSKEEDELKTLGGKKRGLGSPKSQVGRGSKEQAFPLKKRREFNRALDNIADGLYFYDKLQKQKQTLSIKSSNSGVPESKYPDRSDAFNGKPVFTYKIIPKGGYKPSKEKPTTSGFRGQTTSLRGKPVSTAAKKKQKGREKSVGVGGSPKRRQTSLKGAMDSGRQENEPDENEAGSETKSELSSLRSFEYARERSRYAMSQEWARTCVQNVVTHIGQIEREDDMLQGFKEKDMINMYLQKVFKRIDRTVEGEVLGDMVESELEDLKVDFDFEEVRGKMEGFFEGSGSRNSESSQDEKSQSIYGKHLAFDTDGWKIKDSQVDTQQLGITNEEPNQSNQNYKESSNLSPTKSPFIQSQIIKSNQTLNSPVNNIVSEQTSVINEDVSESKDGYQDQFSIEYEKIAKQRALQLQLESQPQIYQFEIIPSEKESQDQQIEQNIQREQEPF